MRNRPLCFCLLCCVVAWLGCQPRYQQSSSDKKVKTLPTQSEDQNSGEEVDSITVQHILIGFEGSVRGKDITRSKQQAEKLAKEILARAQAGEEFTWLVQRYSDDFNGERPSGDKAPTTVESEQTESAQTESGQTESTTTGDQKETEQDANGPGESATDTKNKIAQQDDTSGGDDSGPSSGNSDTEPVTNVSLYKLPGVYRMVNYGLPGQRSSIPALTIYKREDMVGAFGNVGFELEVGEIGMANHHEFDSPFGWHIIKRLE